MVVLRRERRFYVMVCVIICAFFLYLWILKNIQTIDVPKPDASLGGGGQTEDRDEPDSEGLLGEDGTDSSEPTIDIEELAQRRGGLEQAKQEYRNQRDRLLRRLGDLALPLEEMRTIEQEMLDAWNVLENQDRSGAGFTKTMAEDYVSIRESKLSLAESAANLAERHRLLEHLVQGIGGRDVGASMDGLSTRIDELEMSTSEHSGNCREIARQTRRLADRAQGSDRGGSLHEVLSQMEAAKVSPELGQLAEQRESEIADECDMHLDQILVETKRDAKERAEKRRMENEEEGRAIRQKTDDALATHESEQQRLDAEVEAKQRAVVFDRDRAKIEHYLVPFIAIKRTYTTPVILDDEIKEFHWANIPLEQAAALSEIEETRAFESGADSFQRLERFTRSRIEMLDERYLPFGQHWSYREQGYLILARELLMKHGQVMVEAELLRP